MQVMHLAGKMMRESRNHQSGKRDRAAGRLRKCIGGR